MADWSIYNAKKLLGDRSRKSKSKKVTRNIEHYVDAFTKTFKKEKDFGKMDFTPNSLKVIDRLIKRTWKGGSPSDEGMDNCILIFGGYVGRVLENTFDGQWWNDGSESVFVLFDEEKKMAFAFHPYTWAMKRLVEGESLEDKFGIISVMAAPYVAKK